MEKEWTVSELINHLSAYPPTTKVVLEDADTNWTIFKFRVSVVDNEVTFFPSDFEDMRK